MTKKQVGWRLSRLLVNQFQKLCEQENLRPSEAVEEFMRRCLDVGNVEAALTMIFSQEPKALLARELKAKSLIASIQGSIKADCWVWETDYADYRELLSLLPSLKDPKLIKQIEKLSKQVNKVLQTG